MEKKSSSSIKYHQLALLLLAFLLGAVATQILKNILNNEVLNFSTIGLIGFVSSIMLGGASIVLAITAIQLGKSSESVLISRNDESIKTQNGIYQKTIETLSRIESSTGVTEKRIEDMIAGRVNYVAESLSSKKITDRKDIEKELKKAFTEKFTHEEREKMEKNVKERSEAKKRYADLHESILLALSNEANINIIKLCDHGSFDKEGFELFDGVFKANDSTIGVSIFSSESIMEDMFIEELGNFFTNVVREIQKGTIKHFFYLSDKESIVCKKSKKESESITKILKEDLQNKIHIEVGNNKQLVEKVLDLTK